MPDFRDILDALSDRITVTRADSGRLVDVNAAWLDATGLERGACLGRTAAELGVWVCQEDHDRCLAALADGGRVPALEAALRMRSEVVIHRVSGRPITVDGERLVLWEHHDLSEEKRLAAALLDRDAAIASLGESASRYRAYFEHNPDGVVVLDPVEGRILEFNDTACAQLGYEPEEFLGLRVADIEALETADETRQHVDTILRVGQDDFDTKQRTKQGEVRDVRVSVRIIGSGERSLYHCVWRDITRRKQVEAELRQSEARFRALVENAPEAIVVFDLDCGRWVDCNDKACRLFQLERDELLTLGPADLSPAFQPDGRPSRVAAAEYLSQAAAGASLRFEWSHTSAHGDAIPCEVYLTRLPSSQGTLVRGSMVDITDRKRAAEDSARLRDRLLHAQKMESVGRLAGGVAHDFNNMLSVILGHAELAMGSLERTHPVFDDLEEIHKAAARSAALTRQLLTFARKQAVAPKVLDLNDTVEGMLKMLERLIGENLRLGWTPGRDVWLTKLDPSQVDQILANLCVNARDAIADVGEITLETGNATFDDAFCAAHPAYSAGEYVWLAVRDTGRGMDHETLAQVFEPFFTTKAVHGGTGLGLATVYGAVKQNGGFIDVSSQPGHGTTFTVYLPRHVGEAKSAPTAAGTTRPGGGHETVLLVEDEPAILALGARMLATLGYRVLSAGSPAEACRIAERHADELDLLISDVVMPEMSGRDLADRVEALCPGVECLFISGYTADVIAPRGVLGEGVRFLQKPFSRQALASAVRDALRDRE